MAPARKTAAQIMDAAEAKGLKTAEGSGITNDPVLKKLEPSTKNNYDRMMDLWDEFETRHPGSVPYKLMTLKHFMKSCVLGWKEGMSADTVKVRFTDFISAWPRRPGNRKIKSMVTESMYHYIAGELADECGLSFEKREQHYLTVEHFRVLMEHAWTKDWYQPKHPGTLVNDLAKYLFGLCTSARIGEFIESNGRRGSGRGMKYKDMAFFVVKNEDGEAETCVVPRRDAKGFTRRPHKRPKHGIYEKIEPLFACGMLPVLAIALAHDAFQDYHTFEEIFAIPPRYDGTVTRLRVRREMRSVPFFQTMSRDGPTGMIEKAMPFSSRMVSLGHRAGYEENITFHAGRREILVKVDANGYSKTECMKFAGQNDPDVFRAAYASSLGVDGQASYWDRPPRPKFFEALRGSTLEWHPQMMQSLPAKVQDDLRRRKDFLALSTEVKELTEKLKGLTLEDEAQAARSRRWELYWRKRKLVSDELSKWQEIQSRKVTGSDTKSPVAARPSFFTRVRRLDPPRDRLARSLFLHVPLRSEEGRSALRDMITLYTENPRVAYRPSLRPKDGRCPVPTCSQEMDQLPISSRWNYVFRCYTRYLESEYGFAQLCFQCDQWITDEAEWSTHCQVHLDDPETLPAQLNPLKFRNTLAAAGQCLFCLFDRNLPAATRFRQFLYVPGWKDHVEKHFRDLELKKTKGLIQTLLCPYYRCALSVDSVQDLRYHGQDIHCIGLMKSSSVEARGAATEDTGSETQAEALENKSQIKFYNVTVETMTSLQGKRITSPGKTAVKRKRGRRKILPASTASSSRSTSTETRPWEDTECGSGSEASDDTSQSESDYETSEEMAPKVPIRKPKGRREGRRIRGRRNLWGSSTTASSSRSTSLESRAMEDTESESGSEASDDTSQSESDHEISEKIAPVVPQRQPGGRRKRRKIRNRWDTLSTVSSSRSPSPSSTALNMSAGWSQSSASPSITPSTSIACTPRSESSPKCTSSQPVASTCRVAKTYQFDDFSEDELAQCCQ